MTIDRDNKIIKTAGERWHLHLDNCACKNAVCVPSKVVYLGAHIPQSLSANIHSDFILSIENTTNERQPEWYVNVI